MMRWFIVLLLVANLALFFWLQQDTSPDEPITALPPPDIGRLQLLDLERPGERSEGPESAGVANLPPIGTTEAAVPPGQAPDTEALPATDPQASDKTAIADAETPEASTVTTTPSPSESAVVTGAPAAPDAPSPDAVSATTEAGGDETVARAENDKAPRVAAAPTGPEPSPVEMASPPPAEPTCARVGPLSPEAADALTARLPIFVQLLSEVTEEVDEVESYYVMIPPLPSRVAGLETLSALEAAGITDTWLFRRGPRRNAISLGVFSQRRIAERRLRNVAAKGFEARLVERTERREVRQLLVKNLDGGDVALSLPLPDGVTAVPQPCP